MYSKDLVPLVSCFASHHFKGLTQIHAVDHDPRLWLSMKPSPAEQWLLDYCICICGSLPSQPLPVYLLRNPAELGHQRLNLVERLDGVPFPLWSNSLKTPTGKLLGFGPGV